MQTTELPTGDGVKMVRAIRDRMYEETKGMTREEWSEYHHKKYEDAKALMQVNPADYDFSFLTQK